MAQIEFKSIPEMFRKEYLGLKPNTLRVIEIDDIRRGFCEKFIDNKLNILWITIINSKTGEKFTRYVTDVTFWNNQYLISWDSSSRYKY